MKYVAMFLIFIFCFGVGFIIGFCIGIEGKGRRTNGTV